MGPVVSALVRNLGMVVRGRDELRPWTDGDDM
jgi:hypothetical protein